MKNRQDLLQPWEMIITPIYMPPWPPSPPCNGSQCSDASTSLVGSPPPPGTHIFGPARETRYWEPVGITVDEDTLPHVLTFTDCNYHDACGHHNSDLELKARHQRSAGGTLDLAAEARRYKRL